MNLGETDAALYRLYAVGLLTYDEALRQAQSVSRLRRAMLEFDQNSRAPIASRSPSAGFRPAST